MGLINSRARATTLGSIALLVVLGISSTWLFSEDSSPLPSAVFSPTARVTQGPFEIHVNAAATIDARQSVTLSSDLPSNKAKLLYLAMHSLSKVEKAPRQLAPWKHRLHCFLHRDLIVEHEPGRGNTGSKVKDNAEHARVSLS